MNKNVRLRIYVVVLILILFAPVGVSALQSDHSTATASDLRETEDNITFASVQGGFAQAYPHSGKLVAIHTESRHIVWEHDQYRRYMDVDPLDSDRILFVAGQRTGSGSFKRIAVVMNWRTGEEIRKFSVPYDTHDIDAINETHFAVANKENHSAYIWDASTGTVTSQYNLRSDFGQESGDDSYSGDWSHLNDIDLHNNTERVLLSPRDFDRVLFINRSTNQIIWSLGEQNNHEILNAQHNPVLLDQNPPTVLVADSENNRIVEYQRTQNGSWQITWSYSKGLNWPRDADRLPNGNTLIVDTGNNRVVEVTPDRNIVWESYIEPRPYDTERLQYGDEPAGPPMSQYTNEFGDPIHESSAPSPVITQLERSYNRIYQLTGMWLFPSFVGPSQFIFILLITFVIIGWTGAEVAIRLPVEAIPDDLLDVDLPDLAIASFGVSSLLLGALLISILPSDIRLTGVHIAVAFCLLNIGYKQVQHWTNEAIPESTSDQIKRLDISIRIVLFACSLLIAVMLVYTQISGDLLLLYTGLGIITVTTAITLFR